MQNDFRWHTANGRSDRRNRRLFAFVRRPSRLDLRSPLRLVDVTTGGWPDLSL
jgi:hypothetical protein